MESKLAVLGGQACIPGNSFHDWPYIEEADLNVFLNTFKKLNSRNYKISPEIIKFEQEFSKYIGTKYCFTLNSGTAALHSAIIGCNLKPTNNVILPAYGFFSTATSVLNSGAKVKFCDIDLDTFNISLEDIRKTINKDTKVIMPVHIFGNPCEMKEIMALARDNGLLVVEDACQAHGSEYNGQKLGSIGDINAFSFHISKNLPTIEGGAVTTDNVGLRDKAASTNLFPDYLQNEHDNLGNNYKFNGLFASIALNRLRKLDEQNNARIDNAKYLVKKLKKYDFLIPQRIIGKSCYSFFSIRIDSDKLDFSTPDFDVRNRFLLALHREGVPTGVWINKLISEMPLFKDEGNYPNAEKLKNTSLYFSGISYPNGLKQMDLILQAVEKIIDNLDDLKKIK
ncbi:MAG: DegT/DnrJ/EryC1/StrS family aminotransferase [Nanoarchaeota archaeon]|nr:DegT/DnrJ/EryC1/StrS family aminotransferase [Nanoarchaeota archaeon]